MEQGQNQLRIPKQEAIASYTIQKARSDKLEFCSFFMTNPYKKFGPHNDAVDPDLLFVMAYEAEYPREVTVLANCSFVVAEKCWLVYLKSWWQDSLAS